jgi:hypothetical protein
MIDIDRETMRLLTQAPKDVPGRPSISTLMRWARKGIRGITLETVLIGGRRYTSLEAIGRFVRRLSSSPTHPESLSPPPRSDQSSLRTRQELDAEGL